MPRDNIFWGLVLLVVGGLFLGDNLGYINFELRMLWPFFIILLGIYILLGRNAAPNSASAENISVPLEGAKDVSIKLEHGAGRLVISGAAPKDQALMGTFNAARLTSRMDGSNLKINLRTAVEGTFLFILPWNWSRGHRTWEFSLNPEIPISLKIESGASDNRLDLSESKVVDLDIDTGASSTTILMPKSAGHTRAEISGGAASFDITIPDGVAASIQVDSGLGSVSVDEARFPRAGKFYRSTDYDKAANTLDLRLEVGVSSITIR